MKILKFPILFLLLLSLLVSCASSQEQKDYRYARQRDRVPEYKAFIKKYPDSEHAQYAKKRMLVIERFTEHNEAKQPKELELLISEANRVNAQRIKKIKGYTVGTLTEKQFINDGWNGIDPVSGKLGIISVIDDVEDIWQKPVNIRSTLVILGNANLRPVYTMPPLHGMFMQNFLQGVDCYRNRVRDKSCKSVLNIIGEIDTAAKKLGPGRESHFGSGCTKLVGEDGRVIDNCRTQTLSFTGRIGNGVIGLRFKKGILTDMFKY